MKFIKRVWAYVYMPVFFLLFGYGFFIVICSPLLQFVSSSMSLITMNGVTSYNEKTNNIFEPITVAATETLEETAEEKTEIPSSQVSYPVLGNHYADISIQRIGLSEPLVFGDSESDLRYSAGQYNGSTFPGELGTTLIGGHNTSTFGRLIGAEVGDDIKITTTYGEYHYTITNVSIDAATTTVIDTALNQRDKDQLILYTCYPVDMLGMTEQRLFIFADLSSGLPIDPNS